MNIFNGLNIKGIQIATVIFLIISVVLIWQIFNIYPEIGILRYKIDTQEMDVRDSEDTLRRLKEFIGFFKKNEEIIHKFDLILPASEDKANILSNIDSIASANGLVALRIGFVENSKSVNERKPKAGAVVKTPDFDSISIKMSLRGSYVSFKKFLIAIEKNLRVMDVVSVNFSDDQTFVKTEESTKVYSYDIELKTYLHKPIKEENVIKLLSGGKFKSFTVRNLDFTKEKTFSGLFLGAGYNINTKANEIGNQNIF